MNRCVKHTAGKRCASEASYDLTYSCPCERGTRTRPVCAECLAYIRANIKNGRCLGCHRPATILAMQTAAVPA